MSILQKLRSYDYLLAVVVTVFAIFGIFMIKTSTSMRPSMVSLYATQQLYVITGVVLMLVTALIDYHFIAQFYIPIYIISLLLLVVVLVVGAGDDDPARWIMIPLTSSYDLSIQPSEFAKIFMIIFMAKFIDVKKENFNHVLMLGLLLVLAVVPVLLIQMQPSLSASLVIAFVSILILFVGGLYFRTILVGLLLIVPAGLAVFFDMMRKNPLFITKILTNYQWTRIQTFLNPEEGSDAAMQITRSLFAIGSAGLYGKGYQNNSYVPNGHNDFIFSVIAEQFGFVGCVVVLGIALFIILCCMRAALRASDMLGRLIAAGVAGMFAFETFVNVGVVTALLPNTGMPFPFLSYGGTAMWVHMMAVGLVLNVGLTRTKSMFEDKSG